MSSNTIEDLERLSLVSRIGRTIPVGQSTLRMRAVQDMAAGETLLLDPYSVNSEIVTVASVDNRDITLTAPVSYAHEVGAPVIRRKFGEFITFYDGLTNPSLSANVVATATQIVVTNHPAGMAANTHWVVIDPYTVECEVRKVTLVAGLTLTVAALAYNHSANDPVFITSNPVLNVKWFGAVGNGIVDDSLALTGAITECPQGGKVHCPSGIYVVASALSITKRISVEGDGVGTIFDVQGAVNLFELNGTAILGGLQGCKLGNFAISGRSGSLNAVYMRACHRNIFENIYIVGCGEAGFYVYGSLLNTFLNCHVSTNLPTFAPSPVTPKYGVRLVNDGAMTANANTFINLVLEGIVTSPGIGVAIPDQCVSNIFIGGTSEGNTIGIQLGNSTAAGTTNNVFLAFHTEVNGTNWDIKYASGQPDYNVVLGQYQEPPGITNWNYLFRQTIDDGTSLEPSIHFYSDLDTGIYRAGTSLAFAHSGALQFAIGVDYNASYNHFIPNADDTLDLGDYGLSMRWRNLYLTAQCNANNMQLAVRTSAPTPANGMIAYADGTSWNPGSGAGFYGYEAGAWVKL